MRIYSPQCDITTANRQNDIIEIILEGQKRQNAGIMSARKLYALYLTVRNSFHCSKTASIDGTYRMTEDRLPLTGDQR
jgi:hypothetical protein